MFINPCYKLIIYLNKNSTHFQVKTWSSNLTINKICFRGIVGLSGGVKRKLKVHAIATKFQAVKDVKKGELSKTVIAEKYGVPRNTFSTWLKNVDEINVYEMSTFGPKR